MSKLKIYGVPLSRASRCMWCAEELALEYEIVPVHFMAGGTRTPEYLKINPNGRVPAIDDGGTVLFESMAINLYLARKHDRGLWPADVADQGRAFQWSFWAVTEVEKPLLTVALGRLAPPEKRDVKAIGEAMQQLHVPFKVLDGALAGRQWLLGAAFTIADLNVAAVLTFARLAKLEFGAWPALDAWLGRCLDRPGWHKVRALREAAVRAQAG